MLTTVAPFATIVILLVWMGFFMLGSLPLMILKLPQAALGMSLNVVQLLTICFGLPVVL